MKSEMMRPRGGLAKVLYEKIHTDARLESMDKEQVSFFHALSTYEYFSREIAGSE